MRRLRFSLNSLVVVVVFCGVALAALVRPTEAAARLLIVINFGLFCLAICGAILRDGSDRSFWTGFAVFGWAYALIHFGPWFDKERATLTATSEFLDLLYQRIHPLPRGLTIHAFPGEPGFIAEGWGYGQYYFRSGCQSLLNLVVALIGGLAARYYFPARRHPPGNPRLEEPR